MMGAKSDPFNIAAWLTMTDRPSDTSETALEAGRPVPEAARRALEEAAARRKAYLAAEAAMPRELGGRGGLEPVRYGDWEIKGLASDF